jgi:mannosyltransferase
VSAVAAPAEPAQHAAARLPRWWPLAALVVLAAVLRLATLDLQSFWFDESFTPVHVLHRSLFTTLRWITKTENSPPLWYIVEWIDYRLLGSGEVALRLPSALAGIALVPVAWGIGLELCGRRVAIATAALVAVDPLFVWYSQEARVYSLFTLTVGVTMLCFLRVLDRPGTRRMAIFTLAGALAVATHYFAVFLLIGMGLWLLADRRTRRPALAALGVLVLVGLALVPLIAAQGGRGTQWIGEWPLAERLQAIPEYFLTGSSGRPLGHGLQLLVALPLLAAIGLGLWRMLSADDGDGDRRETARPYRRAVELVLWLAIAGILIPLALALLGQDYLAPRNLIGAMVPVSALIALLGTWPGRGIAAPVLLAVGVAGLLAITLDVDLSPRLQRSDWRGVAQALPPGSQRVIATNLLGSAPMEYYIDGLHPLAEGSSVRVREIVELGEKPLVADAGQPPVAGFRRVASLDVHGLIVYRFRSGVARGVPEAVLRDSSITDEHGRASEHADVLVPGGSRWPR